MKHFSLLLIFSVLLTFSYAQQGSSIYINLGGTATNFTGEDVSDSDLRYTWHGGVLIDNPIGQKTRFLTGLQYGQIGDDDNELNFVTLPLQVGYTLFDNFRIYIGPSVNVRSNVNAPDGIPEGDFKDQFTQVTIAGLATVSYTSGKFLFYTQYQHDLQNAFEENLGTSFKGYKQHIKLGIGFKLFEEK
ncbi:MAG: hypothetical protein AAF620_01250 [Bacteroidota bacterium]